MSKDLIFFDSGEGSERRAYIESLLKYYLVVKGAPILAVSPVNPQVTRNYVALLPPFLKKRIFSMGSYHVLCGVSERLSEIINFLGNNPENQALSQDLFQISHKFTNIFVQDLLKNGFKVILDRSLISHYGYQQCFHNLEVSEKVKALIKDGSSYFFVESPKRTTSDLRTASFYDMVAPELNLKLKHWLRAINTQVGGAIHILSAEDSFQDNFDKIKKILEK